MKRLLPLPHQRSKNQNFPWSELEISVLSHVEVCVCVYKNNEWLGSLSECVYSIEYLYTFKFVNVRCDMK